MLLRPPFIQEDDVKSQTSNAISQNEKEKSVKSTSKNKKKENTLGMRKNNIVGMPYNNASNTETHNYDSDAGSVHSVNSRKSKGKTKESTIAIGKKQPEYNANQNSAYSIKNNQNQKQEYEIFKLDEDDDKKSVGSHASKNSRKNTVKENSLGKNRTSKVNVQLNYYYNQKEEDPSPRNYYMEEESKVQIVKLNENVETFTQPLKYNEAFKGGQLAKNPESKRRTEQVVNRQTSSPFEDITLKREEEDEEPVYRLKEPDQNVSRNYQTGNNLFPDNISKNNSKINRQEQNPFAQRNNNNAFVQNKTPIDYEQEAKKNIKVNNMEESSTIQPQMISTKSVTKSRRNKIFDNDNNSISNSSNIMNSRSNMEGSFEKSRSKSKSKLGELLKESRDKKEELTKSKEKELFMKPSDLGYGQQPKIQQEKKYDNLNLGYYNNCNVIQNTVPEVINKVVKLVEKPSPSYQNSSSNLEQNNQKFIGGQKLAENHLKPLPIGRKSIENEVFDLGESQLELNLSMSHKIPEPSGIKGDSVLFNFEPEKKKGISITSKEKPSAADKSIESKRHLDRLMKKCQENEEFLAKSILSNNSELRESKKPAINPINSLDSPSLMKKEETLTRPFEKIKEETSEVEPAWHEMVKNDAAFQIKEVERKEIRRPSKEVVNSTQSESVKPMSPAEFFRLENQQNLQKNIKLQEPNQERDSRMEEIQLENERRIQKEEKNRILAQINKKSKGESQKEVIAIVNNPSSNKNIKPESLLKSNYNDEEINLNYSDAMDSKLKSAKNEESTKQYLKDQVQTSSLSHELSLSENGSERSNSQSAKKQRKKESSLNIMKKHKVQVREQEPRAEESFYEEPPQEIPVPYIEDIKIERVESEVNTDRTFQLEASKTKVDYKKPNLINFQENEIEEEKIKSKTDMNFYNYGDGSQRSIKPPSSKPPLSRKSNCSSSKSRSKAKESTLNINPVKKETKIKTVSNQSNNQQQPKKKKTLLEIAQDKEYEGSGYGGSDSQCSFNSRESFGSVNSKGSRRSSSSKKESTLPITIKSKATTMNQFKPSLNKITSTNSEVEVFSNDNQSIYNILQEQSMRKESRERERPQQYQPQYQQREERTIVSKDTYFIDERGRLVKQDLIIKGNQIYGQSSNKSAEQMAMERMKRSREHHRSRSKSRDGSRSRLSKKTSGSSMEESNYSASSSNYFNNNNGTNYGSQYANQQKANLYIDEFIKPVQHPTRESREQQSYKFQKPSINSNQRKIEREFYENEEPQQYYESYYQNEYEYEEDEPVQTVTLNELFGKNKKTTNNMYNNTSQNSRQPTNQSLYQQQESQYYSNNNNRKQEYGNNSHFNGQESRQTNRKKSISRTEKTFYNR